MSSGLAVKVGPKGRVVLPVQVRRTLNIEEGDELVVVVEDDGVLLMTREAALARIRMLMGRSEGSAVDELLEMRRAEVRREEEERERRGCAE